MKNSDETKLSHDGDDEDDDQVVRITRIEL